MCGLSIDYFFFSSRRRHTRCAVVTGVQTCALPISRRTAKPLLTVLFVATAFAAHYIGSFKVYLDPDMIRNVLETDPREAGELIGPGLVLPLLGLAVLPVAVLWRLRLRRRPLLRALWIRPAFLVAMLVLAAGGALSAFPARKGVGVGKSVSVRVNT